jgi:HSP20 family protein
VHRVLDASPLPEGADLAHAKSELADGVLTITIPKKPESESKKIPITSGVKS